MTTGADLLASALKAHFLPYDTSDGRCDPLHSGWCDCSGLCSFAMDDNGIYNGCGNSTGIETWATNNGGVYVSRDFAASNPGVMAAIWGIGARGHIFLTVGDGGGFGTPSDEGHFAGFCNLGYGGVDRYFTVPGVTYGAPEPPAAPVFAYEDALLT